MKKNRLLIIILIAMIIFTAFAYVTQKNYHKQKVIDLYGGYQTTTFNNGTNINFVFDKNNDFAMYSTYFEEFSGKYYLMEEQRYLLEFNDGFNIEIELFEDSFYFPIEVDENMTTMIKFKNISKTPTYILENGN